LSFPLLYISFFLSICLSLNSLSTLIFLFLSFCLSLNSLSSLVSFLFSPSVCLLTRFPLFYLSFSLHLSVTVSLLSFLSFLSCSPHRQTSLRVH
jgi:hypothetical protein